jgi:glycosyltransferase involved in cell wall biosynthesis
MTRLANDYRVLFVNSLGMRVPSLRRDPYAIKKIIRKFRSISRFLKKVKDGMYVLSPLSLPLFGTNVGRKLNAFVVSLQVKLVATLLGFRRPIIYVGCPPALEVIKKFRREYLIYGCTDIFEEMPEVDKSYISSLDDELTRVADLVLYVTEALWKQGLNKNKNSLYVGHGVDFDMFANVGNSNYTPEDIAQIPRPVIGFFGDICEKTSDMALLEFVAETLPDMSLVLVGSVSSDVSRLKQFGNVYFLGKKPYRQIPFYGKEFDVAIMPWNRNRWIEFCSPVKLKEYLALGKPVVSVYYPEIKPYADIVYVAKDYDGFISCIHRAVQERDPNRAEERRKRVQNETWDNKVEHIKAVIEEGLN